MLGFLYKAETQEILQLKEFGGHYFRHKELLVILVFPDTVGLVLVAILGRVGILVFQDIVEFLVILVLVDILVYLDILETAAIVE